MPSPQPPASARRITSRLASSTSMPSRKCEFTSVPGAGIGLVADRNRRSVSSPSDDDAADRQAVFAREFEVALVVRRARRTPRRCRSPSARSWRCRPAAAIAGSSGCATRQPGVEAQLLLRSRARPRWCRPACIGSMNAAASGLAAAERLRDRMIGRDRDEARAEDRVGPRGEDLDRRRRRRRARSGTAAPGSCRSSSPASAGPCRANARALSSPSSNSSAKSVIFRNHWLSLRRSTSAPERQPRPSITCSLASTVMSTGSQLTALSLR